MRLITEKYMFRIKDTWCKHKRKNATKNTITWQVKKVYKIVWIIKNNLIISTPNSNSSILISFKLKKDHRQRILETTGLAKFG